MEKVNYWRVDEGSKQSYTCTIRDVIVNLYSVRRRGFAKSIISCLKLFKIVSQTLLYVTQKDCIC